MRQVSGERLADLLNNSDPACASWRLGTSGRICGIWFFYSSVLHIISHATADSHSAMLMTTWSANGWPVGFNMTCCAWLQWCGQIGCDRAVNGISFFFFFCLRWKLFQRHLSPKKRMLTSMRCNLLSAAERCRSSFSTDRSLISSMLFLLMFRTQRDSCAKNSYQWRERGVHVTDSHDTLQTQ